MKPGQRVMVIAWWFDLKSEPPPIGSIGTIVERMGVSGGYIVNVDDWPCPSLVGDPEWYAPAWALIPIDQAVLQAEFKYG